MNEKDLQQQFTGDYVEIEKRPFFSVVIPLYNKERHIRNTIKSVLSQTFQDFEIVVVNDGSKDNSADIVEKLSDDRIRIIHQDNAGVSAARNKGIKKSKARHIALLDADDLWLSNHLEDIAKLIFSFPQAGIYATAYKVRNFNGIDNDIRIYGLQDEVISTLVPSYFKSAANGDNLVCSSAVCIPKSIFEDNNIWFPVGEKYGEDQYVWARIAVQYSVAYCTNPSAIYDHGAENNTITAIQSEIEPHRSFYMINDLREMIESKKMLKEFDRYVSKIFYGFPHKNMLYRNKLYGLKQTLILPMRFRHKLKLIIIYLMPRRAVPMLKKSKKFLL